jgi:hypothetical protein
VLFAAIKDPNIGEGLVIVVPKIALLTKPPLVGHWIVAGPQVKLELHFLVTIK